MIRFKVILPGFLKCVDMFNLNVITSSKFEIRPIYFNYKGNRRYCSVPCSTDTSNKLPLEPDEPEDLDLRSYGSVLLPTYNFAAYADKSVVLQEFIKMGVELYKLEKDPKIGEFLLQLDFNKNVKPYIVFLHDNGVAPDQLGKFITKNPYIFKEDLNDLEVRINYLKSKKFSPEMISNIITKNPMWLIVPVKAIDKRLGYLQQTFNLKGDQVREMITKAPQLTTIPKKKIIVNTYMLKEEMGLDEHSLKKLVLQMPSLLKKDEYEIMSTFLYLTKTMKIPLDLILQTPIILTRKHFFYKERHKYLEQLGRAQYNPLLPGYVPLYELFHLPDNEFCEKIAKTSVLSYNEFLKTL